MTPADVLPPEVDPDDVPPDVEMEVEPRPVLSEPDVVDPLSSGIFSRKASGRLQPAPSRSRRRSEEERMP